MSLWGAHQLSISAVPSEAPKRVWGRSVSAATVEVIWEALPVTPERVLGYEVGFTQFPQ